MFKWIKRIFSKKEADDFCDSLEECEMHDAKATHRKLMNGKNPYRIFETLNDILAPQGIKIRYECLKGASYWVDDECDDVEKCLSCDHFYQNMIYDTSIIILDKAKTAIGIANMEEGCEIEHGTEPDYEVETTSTERKVVFIFPDAGCC